MTRLRIFFVLIFSFLITVLHAQTNKNKTLKPPGGLEYRIFKSNPGAKATIGDLVFFKLKGKVSDSILYDTYRNLQSPYMYMTVHENFRKGSIEEGLTLLTRGDSALFILNSDSFFINYGIAPPPFVKKADPFYFYLKVDSIVTKKTLMERKATEELKNAAKQQGEIKLIEEYIKSTGKVFTKTASGLYYIVTKKTIGAKAAYGDKVGAIYTGKLLNGTVFDSNKSSGQPFEFTLGLRMVIAGWDEIFGILNEGENATIVLPSSLGYGAEGSGSSIGPYSPLVFDVEFIKITKGQ